MENILTIFAIPLLGFCFVSLIFSGYVLYRYFRHGDEVGSNKAWLLLDTGNENYYEK